MDLIVQILISDVLILQFCLSNVNVVCAFCFTSWFLHGFHLFYLHNLLHSYKVFSYVCVILIHKSRQASVSRNMTALSSLCYLYYVRQISKSSLYILYIIYFFLSRASGANYTSLFICQFACFRFFYCSLLYLLPPGQFSDIRNNHYRSDQQRYYFSHRSCPAPQQMPAY